MSNININTKKPVGRKSVEPSLPESRSPTEQAPKSIQCTKAREGGWSGEDLARVMRLLA